MTAEGKLTKPDHYSVKMEFNDSTTSFNRNIAVHFESSKENVKTLITYAREFIEEQRRNRP